MASHLQLYIPTRQEEAAPLPPLTVTGALAPYRRGEAYSGFLTINGAVGKCTVQLISGSLPSGYRLYVDNVLKRVYLKWDAYVGTEGIYALPNYSFEDGEEGWQFGEGWSVTTGAHHHGTKAAAFSNFTGDSEIVGPLIPLAGSNAEITLRCQVQQGASSKGNVGARVFLRWYSGPAEVSTSYGNLIDSASGGAWKESAVAARRPSEANAVRPGIRGTRKKQNKPLYVDEVAWDFRWIPGYDSSEPIPLTLQVKDSLNRVAVWSGTLVVFSIEPNPVLLQYTSLAVNYASFTTTGSFSGGSACQAYTARGVYSYGAQHWMLSSGRLYRAVDNAWTLSEVLPSGDGSLLFGCGSSLLATDNAGRVLRRASTTWEEVANFTGHLISSGHGAGTNALVGTSANRIALSTNSGLSFGALSDRLDTGAYSFNLGSYNAIQDVPGVGQFVLAGRMWGGPHGLSSFIPSVAITSVGGTTIVAYPVVVEAGTANCVLRVIVDEEVLWLVGTHNGLFTATNPSGSWTKALTTSLPVTSIAFDGVSYFVTTGGTVMKSADLLAWETISVPSSGQALYVHTLTKE